MKTLKLAFFSILVSAVPFANVYAVTLTTKAPVVNFTSLTIPGISTPIPFPSALNDAANAEIQTAFTTAETDANAELVNFKDQQDLAKGFGNANAYAGRAGTQQGYQDYSLFSVTSGVMLGVQAPRSPFSSFDNIEEEIERDGDIFAGLGVGGSIVNLGINANALPFKAIDLDRFFFNVKFGTFSISKDNFDGSFTTFGLGVNYAYKRTKSFGGGALTWRGITFGTGFLYNKNTLDFDLDLTDQTDPVTFTTKPVNFTVGAASFNAKITGDVKIDPSFTLGLHSSTYSFPLEVNSSVRLLWFLNLNLGFGIDFIFGSTDIIIKSSADVTPRITSVTVTQTAPVTGTPQDVKATSANTAGNAAIDGSTTGVSPTFANLRVNSGIGFNLGPVKLDIPVAYYFNSGLSAGVTAGVVW